MKKKKVQINPICGKRLQELISSSGMSQKEFAEKSGYSPEYISVLVTGKKAMPPETAKSFIQNFFPDIRLEWLMGEDNYRTEFSSKLAPALLPIIEKQIKRNNFQKILELYGFEIVVNMEGGEAFKEYLDCNLEYFVDHVLSDDEKTEQAKGAYAFLEKRLESDAAYKLIHKSEGMITYMSEEKVNHLAEDICDYIEFKIERLCNQTNKKEEA